MSHFNQEQQSQTEIPAAIEIFKEKLSRLPRNVKEAISSYHSDQATDLLSERTEHLFHLT